jgi:hypothetical protein
MLLNKKKKLVYILGAVNTSIINKKDTMVSIFGLLQFITTQQDAKYKSMKQELDNVQKINNHINVPYSQTLRFYLEI